MGAIFALVGVAAGAFGAHGLQGRIPAERLLTFETGARYQMYHAFAIMLVALAGARWQGTLIHSAAWLFAAGIVVFSGSLYALAFGAPRWFGAITPLGGLAFLCGWLVAALAVLRSQP